MADLERLIAESKTFVRLERSGRMFRAFGKRGGIRAWGTDSFPSATEAVLQLSRREEADRRLTGDRYALMFRGKL